MKKISVKQVWLDAFEVITRHPIVLLPFFIVAFLELLALEFIVFIPRKPLSLLFEPIIKKFFGEMFMHYPFFMEKVPKIFYAAQILLYVVLGVALSGIAVNIVRNLKAKLPLKTNALIGNALRKYISFIIYGVIIVTLVHLVRRADTWAFGLLMRKAVQALPGLRTEIVSLAFALFFFITNVVLQIFFILTVPVIVIRNKFVVKALWESIVLGLKNFFGIGVMIGVPYLLYLPVSVLKAYSSQLGAKTLPEITIFIIAGGVVLAAFVDCFITVSAARFLLEKEGAR